VKQIVNTPATNRHAESGRLKLVGMDKDLSDLVAKLEDVLFMKNGSTKGFIKSNMAIAGKEYYQCAMLMSTYKAMNKMGRI
jgi:hypothetical protein